LKNWQIGDAVVTLYRSWIDKLANRRCSSGSGQVTLCILTLCRRRSYSLYR